MLRLGWSHEFADLGRPVTAAFAERTTVYLRYDGDLAGGNTNHILSAGIRFIW
jgi:hypothetical protein